MKKNNYLLLVSDYKIIDMLKKESNVTFLFPLTSFSVGFKNTFSLEEINVNNAYLFVNRMLDHKGIEEFKMILKNLPANIKGIVFDDIGILNVLIEENIPIQKILFLNHLNCNYESINTWLLYVDSVVPSTDITIEELDEILKEAKKPLTLFTFGHVNIMYSRRNLITNYNKHFNLNVPNESELTEKISKEAFKIIENEYGTVIYTKEPFNGLVLRQRDNVLFHIINTIYLSNEEIIKIIKSIDNLEKEYPYKYLSNKKTIVKIKEEEK